MRFGKIKSSLKHNAEAERPLWAGVTWEGKNNRPADTPATARQHAGASLERFSTIAHIQTALSCLQTTAGTVVSRLASNLAMLSSAARANTVSQEPADVYAEIATIRVAIEHVGRGVQMISADGRIVVANALAAEMLGVSFEFLSSKPLVSEVVAEQWRRGEFEACSVETKQQIATHKVPQNQPPRFRRPRPNGRMIEIENINLPGGGVVRTHTDITDRHETEQRIAFLAHNDFLTGLSNRARFQEALEEAANGGDGFSVILFDIDFFKQVNDALGHHFGDAMLREVAQRVRAQVRECDVVARIGGDELALLITPISDGYIAEAIAAQIVTAMRQPFEFAGRVRVPSASLGVTFVPPGPARLETSELAQWRADMALYGAKAAGRGCWRVFDPLMAAHETEERRTLAELRTAIAEGRLEVFYQPIIDLKRNVVSGFEALARWNHPSRGLLTAGEFVPIAERSGLIVSIGLWVLKRACRDALGWPKNVRLLVNLSPRQLSDDALVDTVIQALQETGFPPHRLELEITETSIVQSIAVAEQVLARLRNLGVRIALDDFGTGHSSLSHIRTLRFDTIKIDRSFVLEAAERADCGAIVRAVTSLARDLDIATIAEGVETKRQLDWIRIAGCDEAQGFLFSKAIPKSEADILLADWTSFDLLARISTSV